MGFFTNILNNIFKPTNQETPQTTSNQNIPITTIPEQQTQIFFNIPDRYSSAKGGFAIANNMLTANAGKWITLPFYNEIIHGNIPDFLRNPIEITVSDNKNILKYYVMPDVLAIGDNSDYIHTPLDPLLANKIAITFNAALPTTKMAKQIWKNAEIKLQPKPNGPPYNAYQQSVPALIKNESIIKNQLLGQDITKLISGHKKDVVICKSLTTNKNVVAIYGWFDLSGKPIQDLNSSSHSNSYYDYSHGIRLISRIAFLNDKLIDIYEVLKDPNLADLISDEGSFDPGDIYKY